MSATGSCLSLRAISQGNQQRCVELLGPVREPTAGGQSVEVRTDLSRRRRGVHFVPHAKPFPVALARFAHGLPELYGAIADKPGKNGPADHRRRPAYALVLAVDQLAEVLTGTLVRQRQNFQGAGLAHQHVAYRLAEILQGGVLQPMAYQVAPSKAVFLVGLVAEQLQARQALESVAMRTVEPVLQFQPGRMAMAQSLLLLDRLRPTPDLLAAAPE